MAVVAFGRARAMALESDARQLGLAPPAGSVAVLVAVGTPSVLVGVGSVEDGAEPLLLSDRKRPTKR